MAAETEQTMTVTLPSDTTVAVERTFDAPARLVWDAHTKPEYIKQWLTGPDGWDMPICEVDLRVGGAYRYGWAHPSEPAFGSHGEFT
ncbi:MAG: SRPBCC domain-containing protein, partial [Dehalococcoidia bacterium]